MIKKIFENPPKALTSLKTIGIAFLFSVISTIASAQLHLAPPSMEIKGQKAIFVDFKKSLHKINYDLSQKKVFVDSRIVFKADEVGNPVFDLSASQMQVWIDGKGPLEVADIRDPDKTTNFKMIRHSVSPGTHEMQVRHELKNLIKWETKGVLSAFWKSDLADRRYTERFLPTNFEFDSYSQEYLVKFSGKTFEDKVPSQTIHANGKVSPLGKNQYRIQFPDYFTAASVFFHTFPKGKIPEVNFKIRSISGRDIPVTIYSERNLKRFADSTRKIIAELEKDYGAWPHPEILIYGAGSGGMEYCGATITSFGALGHELIHSYFARGVMPVNGNAGWIDEAIASWRDRGYPRRSRPSFRGSKMGNHSPYRRTTDRAAYSRGRDFLGYLDGKMAAQGGLKPFLRALFQKKKLTSIKAREFQNDLQSFSGQDFSADFDKYIYGMSFFEEDYEKNAKPNPHHPELTYQQLMDLL